nr:hypothetical protein [uncultured Carboxylicivirga sp.]
MNKEKYIYGLGGLFFFVVLVKYVFVPTVFPPLYYTFEIISLLIVLGLIYFVGKFFMLKSGCDEEELKIKVSTLQAENYRLKDRVKILETQKNTEEVFHSLKEKMMAELNKAITNYGEEELASIMFNLVKENTDIVAGILYKQCEEGNCYTPVENYGLDEDWKVDKLVVGEGVHGQVVIDMRAIELTDIPEDYLVASSGTGCAQPAYIYYLPFKNISGKGMLIEVSSFSKLGLDLIWNEFLDNLTINQN